MNLNNYRAEVLKLCEELPTPSTIVNPDASAYKCIGEYEVGDCRLTDCTSIEAAIKHNAAHPDDKIAILNFASYKTPGGAFLNNSLAQEEHLCYCTNLYPALKKHEADYYKPHLTSLNRGLYTDTSILVKDVTVFAEDVGKMLPTDQRFTVDVLTCAAPNWGPGSRYGSVSIADMIAATQSRINYIIQVLSGCDYNEVILGAFGCGVFKNDPEIVVNAFNAALSRYDIEHATFAIPDKNCKNYKVFAKYLENYIYE